MFKYFITCSLFIGSFNLVFARPAKTKEELEELKQFRLAHPNINDLGARPFWSNEGPERISFSERPGGLFSFERPEPLSAIEKAMEKGDDSETLQLLSDPKTNINTMRNDLSLLYRVWSTQKNKQKDELFHALLNRPDLLIDQKGNGIGDHGETVLGVAIGFVTNSVSMNRIIRAYITRKDGLDCIIYSCFT